MGFGRAAPRFARVVRRDAPTGPGRKSMRTNALRRCVAWSNRRLASGSAVMWAVSKAATQADGSVRAFLPAYGVRPSVPRCGISATRRRVRRGPGRGIRSWRRGNRARDFLRRTRTCVRPTAAADGRPRDRRGLRPRRGRCPCRIGVVLPGRRWPRGPTPVVAHRVLEGAEPATPAVGSCVVVVRGDVRARRCRGQHGRTASGPRRCTSKSPTVIAATGRLMGGSTRAPRCDSSGTPVR